ncbi:MAG: hypothetical protein U0893_17170 [Chloroflexota bacterium]
MWRLSATLLVVATLILLNGSTAANGQSTCIFAGGFATLRHLLGSQLVGDCLESEHFNVENGNSEQRTTGGLLVWRKADNVTAFTDGVTTWLNGPNGLESRPNGERLAWETDPATTPPADPPTSSRTVSTIPPPRSAPASAPPAPVPAAAAPAPMTTAPEASSAAGTSPPPAAAAASSSPVSPTPGTVAQASGALTPTPTPSSAATAKPSVTPTKTPNAVEAKFVDKPEDIDVGNELKVAVRTNMKQGACSLIVAYNNSPDTNYGGVQIDDGRCEWKLLLAPDVKTGTAKLKVSLSGDLGTATLDDEFRVSKGDTIHQGDVNIGLDLEEAPKEVKVGQEFKVTLNTDAKNRSSCEAVVAWPGGLPGTRGETKNPDGNGKCTWRFTVPTAVTKKGEASLQVIVRNKNNSARIATRKFEVRPS